MQNEKGNWPAQNTAGILRSVERVLRNNDITELTKAAYQHITAHMSFIAHYSRGGFCDVYSNVAKFAERLLRSEYSNDPEYNARNAGHYDQECFIRDYGKAHCDSVVACNKGIVALARKYLPELESAHAKTVEQAELAELHRLANKHNVQIIT